MREDSAQSSPQRVIAQQVELEQNVVPRFAQPGFQAGKGRRAVDQQLYVIAAHGGQAREFFQASVERSVGIVGAEVEQFAARIAQSLLG